MGDRFAVLEKLSGPDDQTFGTELLGHVIDGMTPGVDQGELDAAGDTLYQNFCSVCHGPTGNADGTVSRQIGAPSLLTARMAASTYHPHQNMRRSR